MNGNRSSAIFFEKKIR